MAILWMVAGGSELLLPKKSVAEPFPDIAIAKGATAAATRAAVELLGGMKQVVKPGNRVIIKPNMSFPTPPERASNTHPEVVRELAFMCKEAGASKILVLDNTLSSKERCLEKSGIREACKAIDNKMVFALSDDSLYKATYSGMGLAFDLSKLCLSLAIGILFYAFRAYIFAAVASIFWTVLTAVSIASAFGFMTVVNNAMESKALVASTAFKSLNAAVESAQARVDSLSLYADPTSASQSAIKIKDLNTQLDAFKNGPAKNSRGQRAGSIASRVGDCSKNGYYSRAYCPKIKLLEQAIAKQERIVSGHNQYLGAVAAKEARLKELSGMDVQNANITGHIHPMFIGIASLTGANAVHIKYIFLCVSSILCELLGSFMLVLYSRLGVDNSFEQSAAEYAKNALNAHNNYYTVNTVPPEQHINTSISTDTHNAQNPNQAAKGTNEFIAFYDTLVQAIKDKQITNLSYKNLAKFAKTLGFKTNQAQLKILREKLTIGSDKVAVFDSTNKLVVI